MVNKMRVKSLSLQNFRLFGDETQTTGELPLDKNIVVIIGDNGAGKTSILDAIALSLAPYIDAFPNEKKKARSKNFSELDVHSQLLVRAPYAEIDAFVDTDAGFGVSVRRIKKGDSKKAPESDIKEIKNYGSMLFDYILDETQSYQRLLLNWEKSSEKNERPIFRSNVQLPIVVYYGTGRGQIYVPERKRNFQKNFPRWDCYTGALLAATDFKRFFSWFDLQEDEERREHERAQNFDFKSKELLAVKKALNVVIGEKYVNPRTETHPLRFIVNDKNDGTELRIEQLSDGYKMAIAMVADIAARMAEANPQMDDPLQTTGVVLIDEIDLHLHPLWQRNILQQLHKAFPNIQFIVTTHSPSVVLGAADIATILKLENGQIVRSNENIAYYDVSQILLSNLFNEVAVRTPEAEEILKRRDELLAKGNDITDDERVELKQKDDIVSRFAFGESQKSMELKQQLRDLLLRMSEANAQNQ